MAEEEQSSPGWDAITAALSRIYHDQEPLHWGTVIPHFLGGPDIVEGISAYRHKGPPAHWHLVTFGLTELHTKESKDAEFSGWGFELTLRIARQLDEKQPPNWAINFLNNLANSVVEYGHPYGAYHTLHCNGPIAVGHATDLTAVIFAQDPELGTIDTPHGKVTFLQAVGITGDELEAKVGWDAARVLDMLREKQPLLVTDLSRKSLLQDPATSHHVRELMEREGSSCDMLFVSQLRWKKLLLRAQFELTLGALIVPSVIQLLRGRIGHGRNFRLEDEGVAVSFEIADQSRCRRDVQNLTIGLTKHAAKALIETLRPQRGSYRIPGFDDLLIHVIPTEIRDPKGNITDVVG